MWYKCLNPNCGFVFPATEECDKCPDCGKQDFRETTDEERKPSLADVIKGIEKNKHQPPKPADESGEGNTKGEIYPGTHPVYQIPER